MSKSNRTKNNNKSIKKQKEYIEYVKKRMDKDVRFDSDRFLNIEQQLELKIKQQVQVGLL